MSASKEIIQKHDQMFYPTVRVRSKRAGGSGTVVYSEEFNKEVYTYVITNHHVVAESIQIEKIAKKLLDQTVFQLMLLINYWN